MFVHDGDDSEISGDAHSEDEEAAYTTSGKHEDGQLGDTNNNADENFVPLKHGIEDAFLNLDEMNAFLDEQVTLTVEQCSMCIMRECFLPVIRECLSHPCLS